MKHLLLTILVIAVYVHGRASTEDNLTILPTLDKTPLIGGAAPEISKMIEAEPSVDTLWRRLKALKYFADHPFTCQTDDSGPLRVRLPRYKDDAEKPNQTPEPTSTVRGFGHD